MFQSILGPLNATKIFFGYIFIKPYEVTAFRNGLKRQKKGSFGWYVPQIRRSKHPSPNACYHLLLFLLK